MYCFHLLGEWSQVLHVTAAVRLQDETEPLWHWRNMHLRSAHTSLNAVVMTSSTAANDSLSDYLLIHHITLNISLSPVSTTRVHGPSWRPVNSDTFFDTRVVGPSWRVSKNAPELTGRQLGPSTRAMYSGNGNRALVALTCISRMAQV